mgnify:CR=1 FL=1
MICGIENCGRPVHCRSLCAMHYQRLRKRGDPTKKVNRPAGAGTPHIDGYWAHEIEGRVVLAHVLIAERALGRRLPRGAQVHHVDEDRMNNDPGNLVVCPSASYHQLLHTRQRALAACGHADWLRCSICHRWSPPTEITLYRPSGNRWHPACWRVKFGKQRSA